MKPSKSKPASGKQQSASKPDQQQQQSGAGASQSKQGKQMGEGSYEGTRDYNQRTAEYLKTHDVKADAEAAEPRSTDEARQMEEAEKKGKARSKGEH
jgi:hypothetical protein